MTQQIDRKTFATWLADGFELAVLDIRPAEEVGYASPLFATNLPADKLFAQIDRFIPRRSIRTVLVDDGKGAALAAADALSKSGWSDIHALEGGIPAWTGEGTDHLTTFDVPGVPFVKKVRDENNTPVVFATELQAWRDAGEDVIVIDTRTLPEYEKAHVPGAVAVPGAELLLRFRDVVPDNDTKVVVSCAGLPRAILGAQTLLDAGVENIVAYLDEGTRGWTEAGYALEHGLTQTYGDPSKEALHFAEQHLATLSQGDDLTFIDLETSKAWANDPERTTYILDVRTPEEFARSHLQHSISSEGGQLLGVAYRTLSVRGARVVLVDDNLGARARIVAHWLKRRGFEIALLLHDFRGEKRVAA